LGVALDKLSAGEQMVTRLKQLSLVIVLIGMTAGPVAGQNQSDPSAEAAIQAQINSVFHNFLATYRLGPGDIIAIHVEKHPEDSLLKAAVSPAGMIYHGLLGNVQVAGKTAPQLQSYLTASISEFIHNPSVTVSLLEAQSAKIGVLGDVRLPGVVLMTRPMKILDAITAVGGIVDTGNSSKVSLLRLYEDGRVETRSVNVKRILQGKAGPEENVDLRAGDTIIVHGNLMKKIGKFSTLVGLGSFFNLLAYGRH
jgi:polysaccharide export outer membrane protein